MPMQPTPRGTSYVNGLDKSSKEANERQRGRRWEEGKVEIRVWSGQTDLQDAWETSNIDCVSPNTETVQPKRWGLLILATLSLPSMRCESFRTAQPCSPTKGCDENKPRQRQLRYRTTVTAVCRRETSVNAVVSLNGWTKTRHDERCQEAERRLLLTAGLVTLAQSTQSCVIGTSCSYRATELELSDGRRWLGWS